MATSTSRMLKMPPFVRRRTPAWGPGGSEYVPYLAAITDRSDLSDARVLGIEGNSDLLLDVVNGRYAVQALTAVEPDLVTAAFFCSHLHQVPVDLVTSDLVDQTEQTLAAIGSSHPFDVAIVRTSPAKMTAERTASTLAVLRPLMARGGRLVITLALGLRTASNLGAGDRLHDRDLLDQVGDYMEYEWELGMIPVHSPEHVTTLAEQHGWSVDAICEPRRGFQQHHLVMTAT